MSGSPRRRRVRREEDISGQFRVTVPDAEDLDQLRTRGGVYRRGLYPLGNRGNAPPEGTQSLPASSRESSTEPMDTDDARRASAEIYRRIRQQAGLSRSGSVGDMTLQPEPLGVMTQGKLVLRKGASEQSQAGRNVENPETTAGADNDGMELGEATKFLAAVIDSYPHAAPRHALPRSRRALKGWKNLDPGRSRPPIPWPVIALISQKMIQQGHPISAMLVLTMFVTYCRPFELLIMDKKDLVGSEGLGKNWAININKSDDHETSKMGLQDETLMLDSKEVPWLGEVLNLLRQKGQTNRRMFPVEYYAFHQHWKLALQEIPLPPDWAVPYQLHHSGASWDRYKKYRSQLEVKVRGRWQADSSMVRYEKHALLNQQFESLGKSVQRQSLAALGTLRRMALSCFRQ